MKKIILLSVSMGLSFVSLACAVCGCANGFSFAGLLPQSNRTFIGIRYKNFSYTSHPDSKVLQSKEFFQQTELWMRFFPFNKVQLMAILPYGFNRKQSLSQTIYQSGVSDPSLLVNYALLNTIGDEKNHLIEQVLTIGAGIKAPLGDFKYDLTNNQEVANPNFQLGTGSWDEMFTINHTMHMNRLGFFTELLYRLNGKNSDKYQFGNRASIALNVFYQMYLPKAYQLNPMVSFSSENWQPDKRLSIENRQTGGQMNWLGIGADLSQKRKAVQAMFQLPVYQQIGLGELKVEPRFFIQLNYFL